ncbi:MAG TPA: hypothetical protein VHD81_06495 [Mycobacteriales bacterium]|nr:hypothetical protein [Mycobacteriales bacterium]
MPLRVRLAWGSAGLLAVSFVVSVATAGRNVDHITRFAATTWLAQATLWLGLFTALAALAAWIVEQR